MEQKMYVILDGMTHSRLHEKGDEHDHFGEKTVVTVVFDAKNALGLLNMNTLGVFDIVVSHPIPKVDENGVPEVYDGIELNEDGEVIDLKTPHIRTEYGHWRLMDIVVERVKESLSTTVRIDDLLTEYQRLKDLWDIGGERLEIAKARREAAWPAHKEYRAKIEALKYAEIAEKNRIKAEAEARLETWIQENGSERLKLGRKEGHNCRKILVSEIVAKEFPGFVPDYHNRVSDKNRSCPSLAALKMLDDIRKRPWVTDVGIFWLPYGLSEITYGTDDSCPDESEACEAIRIKLDITPGDSDFAYLPVE